MKDLIIFLLTPLVENIDEIEILESEVDGKTEYTIKAPKSDMGHIIGKEGKLISSIRQLVRLRGVVDQVNINLKLEEK